MIEDSYASSLHAFRKTVTAALREVKLTQLKAGFPHQMIVPLASYCPWLDDAVFVKLWQEVRGHTLVDIYRCYELWDVSRQLRDLPGDVLEVGVWRGGTAAILGRAAASGGTTSRLWLADTFQGVPKAGERDSAYKGGEHADTSEELVRQLLQGLGLSNYVILRGVFPDETGSSVGACGFKLCHIDVDTYRSAQDVFAWVWPRLVPGGVVVFDDYGFWGCEGVTCLVNELKERGVRVVYNLNGHALAFKSDGGEASAEVPLP